jgi:hypothetical protein
MKAVGQSWQTVFFLLERVSFTHHMTSSRDRAIVRPMPRASGQTEARLGFGGFDFFVRRSGRALFYSGEIAPTTAESRKCSSHRPSTGLVPSR